MLEQIWQKKVEQKEEEKKGFYGGSGYLADSNSFSDNPYNDAVKISISASQEISASKDTQATAANLQNTVPEEGHSTSSQSLAEPAPKKVPEESGMYLTQ